MILHADADSSLKSEPKLDRKARKSKSDDFARGGASHASNRAQATMQPCLRVHFLALSLGGLRLWSGYI